LLFSRIQDPAIAAGQIAGGGGNLDLVSAHISRIFTYMAAALPAFFTEQKFKYAKICNMHSGHGREFLKIFFIVKNIAPIASFFA
jgi:hypothetical protein